MIRTLAFAAAAMIACGSNAFAAYKPYNGDYTLQFYIDPGSVEGASFCLALTQTSNINGFSNSGTFTDTGGVGLSGQFLVDGRILHMVVISSPYGDNVDLIGKANKTPTGWFDDFANGVGIYDSGTFAMTKGCAAGAKRPSTHHVTTY